MKLIPHSFRTRLRARRVVILSLLIMLSLLSASGLALQHADASGASWRERAAATATKLRTGYATTRARLATYFAALTVTNDNRNSPAGGIENKGAMTARNSAIVASNGEPFPVTAFACPTSFTVNDLGDAADATPGDQICATAGGVCTLRAAIQEANAITACTPLTIDFSVTGTITHGSALPAIAHPNLTITGPGASSLTVSGNNLYRVLSIASGSYNVSISGLTLANGYIKAADTTAGIGTNAAFTESGAGLYSLSSGMVNVTDCVITNNTAQGGNATGGTNAYGGDGQGAGIYLQGSTAKLTRCTISNNSSLGGLGMGGTTLTLDGTGRGAGVYKNSGSLTVEDCTIADNITDRIAGSVLSNFTQAQGAGIYNASGVLTVTGSTFSGNRRPNTLTLAGAAIANQANSITWTLTNCTFSGNTGSNTIAHISQSGTLTMVNCTVANNTLTTGNFAAGAIFNQSGSTLNLKNTVLGNNTDGPNVKKNGTVTSQGNNFDSDGTTGFTNNVNGDIVGTTGSKKNPRLSALGNYGGLTKTQVPLPDSQLLDAGTSSGAPTTDQRGIARAQGSAYDIGAVEAQAFTFTLVGGNNQNTTVGTQFPTPLQVNLKEGSNNIQGAPISYVAPGSVGVASTSPTSNTATTDASGNASLTATANTVAGSYNVSAFIGTLVKQFALTNNPGAATNFVVSAPSPATAGTAFNFTVTVRDSYGNTVTGYNGTVHFTSTDGVATLPANSTLTNGVGTFSATLKTAGVRTITATDTVTPAITGTSNDITVNPGAATTLMVMAPANATLGSSFNFTVTAKDAFGNIATGYSGTVHFTSTDGAASLPANSTLTNGTGTFSATLNTINNQTITATDTVSSAITGTSNNIFVSLGTCPTTFTVNDLGDTLDVNLGNGICADASGKCTLRAAIQEANALTACTPLTINFNVTLPNTIMLGSDLPTIAHPNLTITGPGANQLTVSGASMYRPFNIGASNYAVTISGLTVANGRGNGGGGLLNQSTGIVNINNLAFTGNAITMTSGGGGIRHASNGTLNVTGSTFINNDSTGTGGGGINNFSPNGIVNVTNCTFSGNLANLGGGIHTQSSGTTNITNCTLVSNGGGIRNNSGTVTVKNTIAVGNGTDISGTVTATTNLTGALAAALLSTLGNHGGTTQTFALLPGSPAINAGTNADAPATDQRGIARPQQTTLDIGAFESRGFTLAVNGGNNQSTAVNSAFTNPLSVTVTSSDSEPVNGGQVTFTPPSSGASAGLTTSPATISGGQASVTATANSFTGSYNVNATAQGSTGVSFMLTNLCPTIMVSPSSLPDGTVGTNYNQVVMATGTLSAASFTVSAGMVPSGLNLSPSGVLSGTPNSSGPFTFTVRATDTNAGTNTCFKEREYSITIACQAPTISDPVDQNVLQGGTATFSVIPSGTPAPTVQWQVSTDGGMNFTDIPMATGNTLTLNNVTAAMNGHRYRAIASNSCGTATSKSALLVVHAAGAKFDDPLVCLVGGDTGIITAFITNNGAAAINASYSATNLAPNLIGIPGSGVASVAPANFVITPASANWNGVLQPGETVNLLFRVQFAPGLLNGTNVCFDATFVIDGNQTQQQICTILNCPVGGINPTVSAQKPASLLVFPYYTSKAATKADTRFTISNLGPQTAFVHVFFIDGASCQPTDQFLCLTAGASYAGKASETDGETTGWILALAVNQQGVPVQFNHLIGNAFVNDGEYVDTYAAEGFAARSPNVAAIQGATALLFFDGVGYDAVPNLLATEVQSPVNAPQQRVVTVGMRGDLNASTLTGAGQVGTGLVINGNEAPVGSFTGWLNGSCQAITTITNTSPRVPTGMNGMIPSGQNGTLQVRIGAGVGLVMTPRPAPWRGIRALHKIGLTTSTLRLPLIPPGC